MSRRYSCVEDQGGDSNGHGTHVAGIDWVATQKASGTVEFAAANFSISSADPSNTCENPANATHRPSVAWSTRVWCS
jgi:hypothetical protein